MMYGIFLKKMKKVLKSLNQASFIPGMISGVKRCKFQLQNFSYYQTYLSFH